MKALNLNIILLFFFMFAGCNLETEPLGYSYEEKEERESVPFLISAKAVDMVLIYDGSEQRPIWTPNLFDGFISYKDPETQKEDWMFDGYLLIEVNDGRGHLYSEAGNSAGTSLLPAGKKEWEWLLEKHFTKGRSIDALNTQIENVKKRLGEPKRKRQVVYALPVPFWKQTDWGILNGKSLDFNNITDRTAAVSWYVDQVLLKWKELNPNNLELAGFYWIPEAIFNNPAYIQIAQNVSAVVKKKENYLFYWMPYWTDSDFRKNWKEWGFDIAYQQPNVAFTETSKIKVDDAVQFAKQHKMSLEFEFTAKCITSHEVYQPWARDHFKEYMESFEKNGVFDEYPLGHYQSQRDWGLLYESTHPADVELSKMYGRTIVERQKKADALYEKYVEHNK